MHILPADASLDMKEYLLYTNKCRYFPGNNMGCYFF